MNYALHSFSLLSGFCPFGFFRLKVFNEAINASIKGRARLYHVTSTMLAREGGGGGGVGGGGGGCCDPVDPTSLPDKVPERFISVVPL